MEHWAEKENVDGVVERAGATRGGGAGGGERRSVWSGGGFTEFTLGGTIWAGVPAH